MVADCEPYDPIDFEVGNDVNIDIDEQYPSTDKFPCVLKGEPWDEIKRNWVIYSNVCSQRTLHRLGQLNRFLNSTKDKL
jgi:hypothetical protein